MVVGSSVFKSPGRWVLFVLVVLLLVPFVISLGFTFPFGDDFARSVEARFLFDFPLGLEKMGRFWWTWSGRYTHSFLIFFFGKAAEGRFTYMMVGLLVMGLYFVSLNGIFNELGRGGRRLESAALAAAGLLALYSWHSALSATRYVLTDLVGISMGNGLTLTFVWALCRLWYAPEVTRRLRVFVYGSAVAAIGCYEHAAIAVVLAAAVAAWLAWRGGHAHAREFRRVLYVAIAFLLISFLARGNFRRQMKRHLTLELILTQLGEAASAWWHYGLGILTSGYLFASVALGLGARREPSALVGRRPGRGECLAVGLAALLLLTFGIVLVHALSDVPILGESKLTASIVLLSAVGVCFVVMRLVDGVPVLGRLPHWLAVLVLSVLACASSNYGQTVQSLLSGTTAAYAASWEKRKAFLTWAGYEDSHRTIEVLSDFTTPFPCRGGEALPPAPDIWPAKHAGELFGLGPVFSGEADPARAYAAALSAADGEASPTYEVQGASVSVAPNVRGGNNDTYRLHWLKIVAPEAAPAQLTVVSVIRKQAQRPVFHAVEKYMLGHLLEDSMPDGFLMRIAGVRKRVDLGGFLVDKERRIYFVPFAQPEWGAISDLYLSFDGGPFSRLRLSSMLNG